MTTETPTKALAESGHTPLRKSQKFLVSGELLHKLLRCAFKQAVRWDIVAKNPFDNTTLPKVKRKSREIWDAATIRKALDECKDGRLYVAINQ